MNKEDDKKRLLLEYHGWVSVPFKWKIKDFTATHLCITTVRKLTYCDTEILGLLEYMARQKYNLVFTDGEGRFFFRKNG